MSALETKSVVDEAALDKLVGGKVHVRFIYGGITGTLTKGDESPIEKDYFVHCPSGGCILFQAEQVAQILKARNGKKHIVHLK